MVLAVDVTNHNDKVWFDQAPNYTDAVHVVERSFLSIRTRCIIRSRLTIRTCTPGPGRWHFRFARNNERGFRLLEEACHEGERNTDPLITLGYKIYPGMNAGGR